MRTCPDGSPGAQRQVAALGIDLDVTARRRPGTTEGPRHPSAREALARRTHQLVALQLRAAPPQQTASMRSEGPNSPS